MQYLTHLLPSNFTLAVVGFFLVSLGLIVYADARKRRSLSAVRRKLHYAKRWNEKGKWYYDHRLYEEASICFLSCREITTEIDKILAKLRDDNGMK